MNKNHLKFNENEKITYSDFQTKYVIHNEKHLSLESLRKI